jgi:hypothetical protein
MFLNYSSKWRKFASTNLLFSFFKVRQPANQRPSSSLGLFDKTILQIVPKSGLLYVQVIYKYFVIYKLNLQVFL